MRLSQPAVFLRRVRTSLRLKIQRWLCRSRRQNDVRPVEAIADVLPEADAAEAPVIPNEFEQVDLAQLAIETNACPLLKSLRGVPLD